MKTIAILLFIILSVSFIHTKQNLPFLIRPQNEVFNKIAKDIKDNLPKNVEIFLIDITLINGSEELRNKLNEKFYEILSSKQEEYNYSIKSEKKIIEENKDIDLEAIKKENELELIALGKYLNLDAVFLSSITFIEDKKKKVWNKETRDWEYKEIALFQGNIFSTENNISLYRFFYYFFL